MEYIMKQYLLPALISLALFSPFAMADDHAAHGTTPAPAEATAAPPAPSSPATSMNGMAAKSGMMGNTSENMPGMMMAEPPGDPETMMQKRMAKRMENRKEMQALWQKIQEAKTPEERQKLMEEQHKMMQSHREEMRKEMQANMQSGDDDMMPPPPPWGYGPPPGYGRGMGMGRPPMMEMDDDMDGPPPPMMRPRHRMMRPGRDEGGCNMMKMMDKMDMDGGNEDFQQHRAAMEKRMENIEKLLEKIADSLSNKQAK
jgi:hypothetical protein